MIERLPDWEQRLHAWLESCAHVEFGYDHHLNPLHHDCCTFSAGAVIALTGHDPAAEFRGRYHSMAGSSRALRRYGAGTLPATLAAKFEERPIGYARRGDLVMVDGMVGVCVGADALFVGEEDGLAGLVRFDRSRWARCWSVG